MLDEQIGQFPAPIDGIAQSSTGVPRRLNVRFVEEGDFFACDGIKKRRKERLRSVRHGKGESLDMVSNAVQSGHACRFGEGTRPKGDGGVFEKQRGGSDAKIMTRQAESWKLFFGDVGKEGISGSFGQPKAEEGGSRRHH